MLQERKTEKRIIGEELPVVAAGLAANLAPALLRSYEEENRLMLEQQLYDKYMAMGMGPQHIGDDEQEVLTSTP